MKHTFTQEVGEIYYCGDHYCFGHKDVYIVCSCGWKTKDYSSYDDKHWRDVTKMKHILEYEGFM